MPVRMEVTEDEFMTAWAEMKGIVLKMMGKLKIPLDDEDAWQQARISLWKAMVRYDQSRGVKLSTLFYRCLYSALVEHKYTLRYGIPYPRHGYQLSNPPRIPEMTSLNETYTLPHGEEVELIDTIVDPHDQYTEFLEAYDRRLLVEQMMSYLSDGEREIVEMFFGLNNRDPMHLGDVAKHYGISREAARQRLHKALRQIRSAMKMENFAKGGRLSCTLR